MKYINKFSDLPEDLIKNRSISKNAKKLYQFILNMSVENGFCHAGNAYFAKKFNVSTVSISNWISSLYRAGYIDIENAQSKHRMIKPLSTLKKSVEEVFNSSEIERFKVEITLKYEDTIKALKEQIDRLKDDVKELVGFIVESLKYISNGQLKSRIESRLESNFKVLTILTKNGLKEDLRETGKNTSHFYTPQEKIFAESFPDIILTERQRKAIKSVENHEVFECTCKWWALQGYRGQSVARIIEKYHENIKKVQTSIGQFESQFDKNLRILEAS